MKTLISILLLLFAVQVAIAQENTARKDFVFVDPVTKEQIKIETGNKVAIRFKILNLQTRGTVLALSDSSLVPGVRMEPRRQSVPFRNIASAFVIHADRRLVFTVTLKSGERVKSRSIRITEDSVTLTTSNSQRIRFGTSEIQSILVRKRGAIGRRLGLSAGAGAIVGAIVGQDAHKPLDCSGMGTGATSWCRTTDDFYKIVATLVGAVAGGATGLLVKALSLHVVSPDKEFKIDGDQAKFDLFGNEFKNKASLEKTK